MTPMTDDEQELQPAEERPSEPAEEQTPSQVEGALPPGVGRARLPLLGEVSFALLVALTGVSALVFVGVLLLCISLFKGPRPAPTAPPPVASQEVAANEPTAPAAPPVPLSGLTYEELMDGADEAARAGDYSDAVRRYRAAAEREEDGIDKALLARYKLAGCLAAAGKYEEALRICEELAAVSRPGDELWKWAQITAIGVLSEQADWQEFFRRMCLLRANSARYSDVGPLDRWLSYCRAMARVRMLLPRLKEGGALFGRRPPALGRAPYTGRPLSAGDIVVTTGKYGDGRLETSFSTGELRLRAEGATLGAVLDAVARQAGLRVEYDGPTHFRIVAAMEASTPEHVLEMVLGSVGLEGRIEEGVLKVQPLLPAPRSESEGMRDALWALREFLILFPESAQVPEAYYALAHLYMTQGRTAMALDQFDVLCKEFPRSEWAVLAHYVAGRAYHARGDWGRAEQELLLAADRSRDQALVASAYLWAAHSQVELQKYEKAANSFRRALADEVNETLAPEILYSIAYCMDMSGQFPQEVEERYLEVRTRYPDTPYARLADFRLARRAFLAGQYAKAATRYEHYLRYWPIDDDSSRDACRDLTVAYLRTGQSARAVLLGEIMVSSFGQEQQYWQALPSVLAACRQSGLQRIGLQIIERSLSVADTPQRRWTLQVAAAECLIDMKKYEEAESSLLALAEEVEDPEILETVRLAEARLWLEQPRTGPVAEVCEQVAAASRSKANRAAALALLGRYMEGAQRFEAAARAYAGFLPLSAEEGSP